VGVSQNEVGDSNGEKDDKPVNAGVVYFQTMPYFKGVCLGSLEQGMNGRKSKVDLLEGQVMLEFRLKDTAKR